MRFAGQAQLGYYPTPPAIAQALADACRPADPTASWTVCDPFCGPADALNAFQTPYRYGIELDEGRAAQARATSAAMILTGNAFEAAVAPHSVSVLFLNPPYDYDPLRHMRYEALALHHFVPALKAHGLVILIFPRSSWLPIAQACMELPLSAPLGLWRFPDPEYDAFNQMVLVAQKLGPRDNADAAHNHYRILRSQSSLTPWPSQLPTWTVPVAAPLTPDQFAWHPLREEVLSAALAQDTHLQALVQPMTLPPPTLSLDAPIATPMTLHRGHLATLLTAGRLTGVIGEGDARHLVKGRVVQRTVAIDPEAAGLNPETTIAAHETQYQVVLTTLHADGTLRTWEPLSDETDAVVDTTASVS